MKIDEYIKQEETLLSKQNKELAKIKAREKEIYDDYNIKMKALKTQAKKENLFRVRLGDFKAELANIIGIEVEELETKIDLQLIIEGDANRMQTMKIYDNNPNNKANKIMIVVINSTNEEKPFCATVVAPFNIMGNNLADGTSFRSNLIIEKRKTETSKPRTYSVVSFNQEKADDLMVDMTRAYLNNMQMQCKQALIATIKAREEKLAENEFSQQTLTETKTK